jgi:hypothetical protein
VVGACSLPPPNPGSNEAIELGCTCPVLDNGHGNPELGRIRGFICREDCPIHGLKEDDGDFHNESENCVGGDVS